MKNFSIFKSVAGKKLRAPLAFRPHWVTPVGSDRKQKRSVFLEIQDMDAGIRYALSSINTEGAKRLRHAYETNTVSDLNLEVVPASVGSLKFQALVANTDGGQVPLFKIGRVIGVVDKFVDNVCEAMAGTRLMRTLLAVPVAAANKIGCTPAALVGKEPSPLPEFEEAGYGARFHMCSSAIAAAVKLNAARLKNK